jgi:hypothetical protein
VASVANVYAPAQDDEQAMANATTDLADDLRKQFRERDRLYEDIDAILYDETGVNIPEDYRKTAIEVSSPLPIHITNTVAAALSTNPVTVQFRPVGFGDVQQQNATAREHFFEASWHRQQDEANRRLTRLFMYALAAKGEGILKTCERASAVWGPYYQQSQDLADQLQSEEYDTDAQDRIYNTRTEEYKLPLPYPIASTDVPPETFYYSQNENGKTAVVEIKQLPYLEALQRFGAGLSNRGQVISPQSWKDLDPRAIELTRVEWARVMRDARCSTLTCIEAWDYQVQSVVLIGPGDISSRSGALGKGTLVRSTRHQYGDPYLKTLRGPYFHALGITTASRLPERAGLSVLFGFLALFPLLNSLLTMQANAAFLTAFPAFKRTLPPGTIPGIPDNTAPFGKNVSETGGSGEPIVPGQIYPYDVAPIDMPRAGVEAEKLIQNVRQMIELALPSVVQGVVASDQSGYALNQAAYLARLAWDPIVKNAQIALGQRVGFESWLIENRIGEKVYAWGEQQQKGRLKQAPTKAGWLGIGPEDLNGNHHYICRLAPETPSNKVIETRALIEQMNARLITYEDAVTENGANPDEVELSWMTQDLKKSPEIQAMIKNVTLQKIATITTSKLARSGVNMQDILGAGGGTPPAPGMPPPNLNMLGAPPPNPVPMPGQGLPIAPPPPGGMVGPAPGAMPPGGIPSQPPPPPIPPLIRQGQPVVPGVPARALPLPGA